MTNNSADDQARQEPPTQDRSQPPSRDDVARLPRWALVAFSCRCAQRVRPLFERYWHDAPAEFRQAIDQAIQFSVTSARIGRPSVDVTAALAVFAKTQAAADPSRKAAERARAEYRAHSDHRIATGWHPSPMAAVTTTDIVNARTSSADAADAAGLAAQTAINAAKAQEAEERQGGTANFLSDYAAGNTAAMAVRAAASATFHGASAPTIAAMWRDLDLLRALAEREQWTNNSSVDPDLLGSLWPEGRPRDWPDDAYFDDDIAGLTVRFEVPDSMSDEEALAHIERYFDALNQFHRALGGSGLQIIPPAEIHEPARVREGVPA